MSKYPSEFASKVYERDKLEFALGDTLDVKSSILLVVLTFLATQSAMILGGDVTQLLAFLQAGAVLLIIFGVACVVIGLWPRYYDMESKPEELEKWVIGLYEHFKSEPAVRAQVADSFSDGMLLNAKERIKTNHAINHTKAGWLYKSFCCTVAALALNVLAIVTRLF